MTPLQRPEIQGLALSAYKHLNVALYLLLRVEEREAARRWLGAVVEKITFATEKQSELSLNVALTYAGLAALGLDEHALGTFPLAFREGMTSERRTKILGDDGNSGPDEWQWGGRRQSPTAAETHILLMVFAADEAAAHAAGKQQAGTLETSGVRVVWKLTACREPDTKEHFGFNDGISQPVIEGSGQRQRQRERTGSIDEVKAGEFLLGYRNEYGVLAESPTVAADRDPVGVLPSVEQAPRPKGARAAGTPHHDLGLNGSYLVVRQLAQDVAGFWQFLDSASRGADGEPNPEARTRLGAKLVGRWPSGAPLVEHPHRDPHAGTCHLSHANQFVYQAKDPHGHACPIGAHVRRANPRDSLGPTPQGALATANHHRLLRRGRSYGRRIADPLRDDGVERGLFFLCLNADLESQFEFVQHTWINNPVFGGLDGEVDPLVGSQPLPRAEGPCRGLVTLPGDPARARVHALPRFVTVKGGAYFFLPSRSALRYLSRPAD